MNKVQDGYAVLRDSTKPIILSGKDRQHHAFVSFVGNRMIVTPSSDATELRVVVSSPSALEFEVVPVGSTPVEAAEAVNVEKVVEDA